MEPEMNKHEHGHHRPWQSNWKSPVALGIFLPTAALSVAIVLYTLLNISVSLASLTHSPSQAEIMQQMQSQGMQLPEGAGPDTAGQ